LQGSCGFDSLSCSDRAGCTDGGEYSGADLAHTIKPHHIGVNVKAGDPIADPGRSAAAAQSALDCTARRVTMSAVEKRM